MTDLRHLPGPDRAHVLVSGLDHPEGVAWDPLSGAVYAGGEAGQLYRVALDAPQPVLVGQAPGFVLGLAVDGVGRVVMCSTEPQGTLCLYDAGVDGVRPILSEVAGEPLLFPNYPAFGPDGTLWLTDSGPWEEHRGRVIRWTPDGTAEVFCRELNRFPNGCAVSPDGRWLWVAESLGPTVVRYDLDGDSRPEVVVRLHGEVPDGLAFTAEGGLLISTYRPDRVYHLDAAGRLEVVAQDPHGTLLAAPTNVCFVGDRLDRVVSANLGRWHLTLLDLGLTGAPLHRPSRWAVDSDAMKPIRTLDLGARSP